MARLRKKVGVALPLTDVPHQKAVSRVRISGPKARRLMAGMSVGKRGTMRVGGIVRSLSSNEYDDSIELELEQCEHCSDAPRSLSQAIKRRKMRDGRFA